MRDGQLLEFMASCNCRKRCGLTARLCTRNTVNKLLKSNQSNNERLTELTTDLTYLYFQLLIIIGERAFICHSVFSGL